MQKRDLDELFPDFNGIAGTIAIPKMELKTLIVTSFNILDIGMNKMMNSTSGITGLWKCLIWFCQNQIRLK